MARPRYFRSAEAFGEWLREHHENAKEIVVGFHKVGTGSPSLTWPESVDEALCVGWIDGIRKRVDDRRYTIRFTPRRAGSHWSAVNIKRVTALKRAGRMLPAGLAAFAKRKASAQNRYSYEQRKETLDEPYAGELRKHEVAAKYFAGRPPGYRRAACWWVLSAKKEETRARRLAQLIEACEAGRPIASLARPGPAR